LNYVQYYSKQDDLINYNSRYKMHSTLKWLKTRLEIEQYTATINQKVTFIK